MENPSPLALTIILIGALMGFGRDVLTTFYLWVYQQWRKQAPPARLAMGVKLYLVMTSIIFTMAGLLGLLGIIKY